VLAAAAIAAVSLSEVSAFMPSSLPMLRSGGALASCRAPSIRRAKIGVRMQAELTDEERKEYEALIERAKELKETYKEIMDNAMPADEPEAPKGFNIPIEEMDESDYVEPEPEKIDPSTLSEEDRAFWEQEQIRDKADKAYEKAEQFIRDGKMKNARKQNGLAKEGYLKCGVLSPGSIFAPSFMDALDDQLARATKVKTVATETSYSKNKQPWDV